MFSGGRSMVRRVWLEKCEGKGVVGRVRLEAEDG